MLPLIKNPESFGAKFSNFYDFLWSFYSYSIDMSPHRDIFIKESIPFRVPIYCRPSFVSTVTFVPDTDYLKTYIGNFKQINIYQYIYLPFF